MTEWFGKPFAGSPWKSGAFPGAGVWASQKVVSYEAESLTLFAAMAVQPSGTLKSQINTLIGALKASGAWDKMDRIYDVSLHTLQAAKLDWKHPGTDSLIVTGPVLHRNGRDFAGMVAGITTSSNVHNTTPFNAMGNYAQDNAHFSVWLTDGVSSAVMGGSESDQNTISIIDANSAGFKLMNGGINVANSGANGQASLTVHELFPFNGWFMMNRVAASTQKGFFNGSLAFTDAAHASTTRWTTDPSHIAAIRGSLSNVALITCGASLEAEAAAVYTALYNYMAAKSVVQTGTFSSGWTFDFVTSPSILSPEGFALRAIFPQQMGYDWEGVPRYTDLWEVPFFKYRRVKNLFIGATNAPVTESVTVISGREYMLSFTGTGSVALTNAATRTLNGQGASSRVALSSGSTPDPVTATTTTLVCTITGDVRSWQLEDVTFQSNQHPGEYISVDSLPYPFHGCARDGIKYFTTENGNTVAAELVDESAPGAALDDTKFRMDIWMTSTNRCLQSSSMGTSPWTNIGTPTLTPTAKPCGDVMLELLGDDDGAVLEGKTQNIVFGDTSGTLGTNNKSFSVFFSEGTSASTVFRIFDSTAAAVRELATLTWSAGVPSIAMTTGTLDEIETLTNGCSRARIRVPGIVPANTNQLQVYPATNAALDATLTGNVYVGGFQCDDYPLATPHTPTTTVAVTRGNHILGHRSFAGQALSWLNPAEGTMVVEAVFNASWGAGTAQQYLFELIDTTLASGYRIMCLRYDNGTYTLSPQCLVNNVQQANFPTPVWLDGEIHKIAYAYKLNDAATCFDGGTVNVDNVYTVPSNLRQFGIGQEGATGQAGHVQLGLRGISYRPSRLDAAAMQAATA